MNFECNHNETREIFDGKFIVIMEQSVHKEILSLEMDKKDVKFNGAKKYCKSRQKRNIFYSFCPENRICYVFCLCKNKQSNKLPDVIKGQNKRFLFVSQLCHLSVRLVAQHCKKNLLIVFVTFLNFY